MKLRFVFSPLFLLLLLTYPAQAQTNESNQKKLRGFSMSQDFHFEDRKYTYNLSTSDIANTPSWNPSREDPPLSLRKALNVSLVNLGRFVKDVNVWEVEAISLRQMDVEKWIYEIRFYCRKSECMNDYSSSFIILTKMDGSIVEPQIKEEEKDSEP